MYSQLLLKIYFCKQTRETKFVFPKGMLKDQSHSGDREHPASLGAVDTAGVIGVLFLDIWVSITN